MDKKLKKSEVSKDETGKLHGGFSIRPIKIDTQFFANNINCVGGGFWDSNTNCTGSCEQCNVVFKPRP